MATDGPFYRPIGFGVGRCGILWSESGNIKSQRTLALSPLKTRLVSLGEVTAGAAGLIDIFHICSRIQSQ